MNNRIYLDHAATTPVIPAAREAMAEAMARWANPSSPHSEGRAARAALEDARARIAAALGWDGEIILTSGASEAIGLALRGHDSVAGAVEHDAVLAVAGPERLPVNADGYVEVSSSDCPTSRLRCAVRVARCSRIARKVPGKCRCPMPI
jgi:cysteine desulfurase